MKLCERFKVSNQIRGGQSEYRLEEFWSRVGGRGIVQILITVFNASTAAPTIPSPTLLLHAYTHVTAAGPLCIYGCWA